ncbi:hypothetical protein DBR43_22870 [Pedobacter sp. KBW06]|uniref:hypothetical protein n=1 Tax=Pedobacter sp. KBW06 TaxID=2153359 RepID=UPI000F59FC66|nr:hypothetical protein [Pedobacter sp. KBW06]RQO67383.1 hypothetical protein DBR43_22870 [Pedobacter sp. KBW06]
MPVVYLSKHLKEEINIIGNSGSNIDMRKVKTYRKAGAITKEKKLERLQYGIVMGLIISFLLYGAFFEAETIGEDQRYHLYIFLLPTLSGMLLLGVYRKEQMLRQYSGLEKVYEKIYALGLYLIQGIVISFLSFGQVSMVIWNYLNIKEAEKNPTEILKGNLTGFSSGKRTAVNFKFNDQYEHLKAGRETIRAYHDKKPEDYVIVIEAKKGLWNYYLVESWRIEKRK